MRVRIATRAPSSTGLAWGIKQSRRGYISRFGSTIADQGATLDQAAPLPYSRPARPAASPSAAGSPSEVDFADLVVESAGKAIPIGAYRFALGEPEAHHGRRQGHGSTPTSSCGRPPARRRRRSANPARPWRTWRAPGCR
ncbi:hypothetical protein [Amycolatopsis sp. RTGN1]|uniref:hypothetical protein n=1 Tax=Amycolatopsis ponsaeliensis TaxID=2992142 RepID=UPI00254F0545|nr:hypothetical protein [Amycolatopsis sp. RTGN1]